LLLGPLSLMEVLMLLLSLIYHKRLSFFMCMCVFWCRYIVADKLFDDMLMRHGNVHPYGSMVTSARELFFFTCLQQEVIVHSFILLQSLVICDFNE
jgi:hypothetical protein